MATTAPPRRDTVSPRAGAWAPGSGARQLLLFVTAYLVYFGVRAITEGSTHDAVANALSLISFERERGIAWEGELQDLVLESRLLMDTANAVYVYGHWPVIIVAGVLLFRHRRPHFFRLRDACLLSGLVGLVIFSLFPVAPPRLTDLPLVDTVTRDDPGYRQIVPPSMVNEYAAMPSFHAGWNLLLGIVVFGATRHWLLRALAVLGPAAMMLAVVATANHFVVDVIAGVAIVLVCLFVRDAIARRRTGRPRIEVGARHRESSAPGRDDGEHVRRRAPRRKRSRAAAACPRARGPIR